MQSLPTKLSAGQFTFGHLPKIYVQVKRNCDVNESLPSDVCIILKRDMCKKEFSSENMMPLGISKIKSHDFPCAIWRSSGWYQIPTVTFLSRHWPEAPCHLWV